MNTFARSLISSVIMMACLVAMDILGIINLSFAALFTFFMMLTGFLVFAYSFGSNHPKVIFGAAMVFFWGLLFFLQKAFEFALYGNQYFPVFLLIAGVSLLLVFIDDNEKKANLVMAAILLFAGAMLMYRQTNIHIADFMYWIWEIIKKTWIVFLLLFAYLIMLLRR